MKIKHVTFCRPLGAATLTVAVMLTACGAMGQNLFVSTYDTGNVYQITPDGTPSTFATGMDYPDGLAFDSSGNLFVGNSADNSQGFGYITEITPGGTPSTFATGINPQGLAFDGSGNLYEADYNTGNIYEFAPGGAPSTFATGFTLPLSVAYNNGNLFVGSGYGDGNGVITKITPGGTSTFATGLSFPLGMAFDSAGDLFVANNDISVITKITSDGTESTFATITDDGFITGLAINNAGDLFVGSGSGNIIEITPDGKSQSIFATVSGDVEGLAFAPVPEPSVMALAGVGGAALIFRRRKS